MWYSSGSCDNLVLIENNELISASFAPAALTKESIMPPIRNDWAKVLAPEYNKPYYRKLFDFVGKEYSTHTIYPPGDDIPHYIMIAHHPGLLSMEASLPP